MPTPEAGEAESATAAGEFPANAYRGMVEKCLVVVQTWERASVERLDYVSTLTSGGDFSTVALFLPAPDEALKRRLLETINGSYAELTGISFGSVPATRVLRSVLSDCNLSDKCRVLMGQVSKDGSGGDSVVAMIVDSREAVKVDPNTGAVSISSTESSSQRLNSRHAQKRYAHLLSVSNE